MCGEVRKPQAEIDRIALENYREIISRLYEARNLLSDKVMEPDICFPRRFGEDAMCTAIVHIGDALQALDGYKRVRGLLWCDANPTTEQINRR